MVNLSLIPRKQNDASRSIKITTSDSLPDTLFELARNLDSPSEEAQEHRSLFILGFARSGKTTLAKKLHEHLDFTLLTLDKVPYKRYSDLVLRHKFFDFLLDTYPRGLVVEGDNLCGENRSRSSLHAPDEFGRSVKSLTAKKAEVVLVGNADATVDEKASAISDYRQNHNCWTSKANYGASQIKNLAKRSIGYSNELRTIGNSLGLPYLEIRPSQFNEDIQTGLDVILQLIKEPTQ